MANLVGPIIVTRCTLVVGIDCFQPKSKIADLIELRGNSADDCWCKQNVKFHYYKEAFKNKLPTLKWPKNGGAKMFLPAKCYTV